MKFTEVHLSYLIQIYSKYSVSITGDYDKSAILNRNIYKAHKRKGDEFWSDISIQKTSLKFKFGKILRIPMMLFLMKITLHNCHFKMCAQPFMILVKVYIEFHCAILKLMKYEKWWFTKKPNSYFDGVKPWARKQGRYQFVNHIYFKS